MATSEASMMATARSPAGMSIETRMAAICLAIAVIGFLPTYWAPLARGELNRPPLIHLHGAAFFAWPLLLFWQGRLADQGRLLSHRAWGLLGISLATSMVFLGLFGAIDTATGRAARGSDVYGRMQMIVPVSAMLAFTVFVALALYFARRTALHRRLMVLATISLLGAPLARLIVFAAGVKIVPGGTPPPIEVSLVPGLAVTLVALSVLLWDWRSRGLVNPTYAWGLVGLVTLALLRVPLAKTSLWQDIAGGLMQLG